MYSYWDVKKNAIETTQMYFNDQATSPKTISDFKYTHF